MAIDESNLETDDRWSWVPEVEILPERRTDLRLRVRTPIDVSLHDPVTLVLIGTTRATDLSRYGMRLEAATVPTPVREGRPVKAGVTINARSYLLDGLIRHARSDGRRAVYGVEIIDRDSEGYERLIRAALVRARLRR